MILDKYSLPIHDTNNYSEVLGALNLGMDNRLLMCLFGEPGTGKTTMLKNIKSKDFDCHYILCKTNTGIKDLLTTIASSARLSINGRHSAYELQSMLTEYLNSHKDHCFLIDESEYLNYKKLDTVRQIWDQTSVPFVFGGTYALKDKMKTGTKSQSYNSQLYRRLYEVALECMSRQEFEEYLDCLETYYAVKILPDVRSELYDFCVDMQHGGLGIVTAIIKLAFAFLRPEWKEISKQLFFEAHPEELKKYEIEGDASETEKNRPYRPVDVNSLKVAVFNKEALNGALKHKIVE